ncbi:plasmid transfer protein (plasmid) [Adhaeribacter swui]|uniref:Plasmid transfer protein n=2 Tax=Adhaeribacter TaxID=299566 RepID=A0A7L7L1A5_9BACT|nr:MULTISPECIES: plasmid transfer protein [Adhaeribacter]QMU26564.1 plasmid transfer protein [Adhaeribacter radiodurans]QNF31177.1 plasmid transfer protein [Adhaeribacter swui]
MRELIDQTIFDLMETLYLDIAELTFNFYSDAQAIAAIAMLLYFALEAYKMIAGDKTIEIMPLMRPFALALVILLWEPFIEVMNFPIKVVNDTAKTMYSAQIDMVEHGHVERLGLIEQVAKKMSEDTGDFEQVKDETQDKDWMEKLGIDLSPLLDKMKGYYLMLTAQINFAFMRLFEYIVIIIFQFCIYIIFLFQIIFAAILVILGPFSFALSIFPGFRDSYLTWIGRYISVGLYSTIAYIIMTISFVLVRYGQEREIEVLKAVLENEELFIAYVGSSSGHISFYLVSLLMAALAMLCIPVISTWIINTTGVSQAFSSVARTGTGLIK